MQRAFLATLRTRLGDQVKRESRRYYSPGSHTLQSYQPAFGGAVTGGLGVAGSDDFIASAAFGDDAGLPRSGSVLGTHGIVETVEAAKVKNLFHDAVFHRCTLCDEQIGNWQGHVVFVPHQARLGIVERVLTGLAGPPEQCVERWWNHLQENRGDASTSFRLRPLSHDAQDERRKRMTYLLAFLVEKKVIRHSLCVWDAKLKQFARSTEFERLEMIGDNIVKCVVQDRMQIAFPPEEGGLGPKLNWIQQLIDSNEGLLRIFDYLALDKIIGAPLAQSKFKSDVVECLFGELQVWLWGCADPLLTFTTEYDLPNRMSGFSTLRTLVEHVLYELTDVVLMWALESTVKNAMPILKAHYHPGSEQRRASGRRGGVESTQGKATPLHAERNAATKYDIHPALNDMPLPVTAASTSNANVVVLRGANVEAKARAQAIARNAFVPPAGDFSPRPRLRVPLGTDSTSGCETQRERALRLDGVWTSLGVSAATRDDMARLDEEAVERGAKERGAAPRSPVDELKAQAAAYHAAHLLCAAEVRTAFMASLGAISDAVLGSSSFTRKPRAGPALTRAPSTRVARHERGAAWRRQRCSVSVTFGPMRPLMMPMRRPVVWPPLSSAPETSDDALDALGPSGSASPEFEAAEACISELTSWVDSSAAHPFSETSAALLNPRVRVDAMLHDISSRLCGEMPSHVAKARPLAAQKSAFVAAVGEPGAVLESWARDGEKSRLVA